MACSSIAGQATALESKSTVMPLKVLPDCRWVSFKSVPLSVLGAQSSVGSDFFFSLTRGNRLKALVKGRLQPRRLTTLVLLAPPAAFLISRLFVCHFAIRVILKVAAEEAMRC